jgi:hypothetical protein
MPLIARLKDTLRVTASALGAVLFPSVASLVATDSSGVDARRKGLVAPLSTIHAHPSAR